MLDVVGQALPQLGDGACQGIRRDESVLPDRVEELVLGHEPVAIRHEMTQDIQRLRLEQHTFVVFPDAHPPQIEPEFLEFEDITASRHFVTRPSRRRARARLTVPVCAYRACWPSSSCLVPLPQRPHPCRCRFV
jgi:hypothetical protein